jgi:hypothetical protein
MEISCPVGSFWEFFKRLQLENLGEISGVTNFCLVMTNLLGALMSLSQTCLHTFWLFGQWNAISMKPTNPKYTNEETDFILQQLFDEKSAPQIVDQFYSQFSEKSRMKASLISKIRRLADDNGVRLKKAVAEEFKNKLGNGPSSSNKTLDGTHHSSPLHPSLPLPGCSLSHPEPLFHHQ